MLFNVRAVCLVRASVPVKQQRKLYKNSYRDCWSHIANGELLDRVLLTCLLGRRMIEIFGTRSKRLWAWSECCLLAGHQWTWEQQRNCSKRTRIGIMEIFGTCSVDSWIETKGSLPPCPQYLYPVSLPIHRLTILFSRRVQTMNRHWSSAIKSVSVTPKQTFY
jgi:hypothetical protein